MAKIRFRRRGEVWDLRLIKRPGLLYLTKLERLG